MGAVLPLALLAGARFPEPSDEDRGPFGLRWPASYIQLREELSYRGAYLFDFYLTQEKFDTARWKNRGDRLERVRMFDDLAATVLCRFPSRSRVQALLGGPVAGPGQFRRAENASGAQDTYFLGAVHNTVFYLVIEYEGDQMTDFYRIITIEF